MTEANPTIVVGVETDAASTVHGSAAELLGAASTLGEAVAIAVALPGQAADVARELGRAGAPTVVVVEDPALATTFGTPLLEALAEAVAGFAPDAVLLAATTVSSAVAGRLAIRVAGAVCADAVGVALRDGEIVAEHSVFGGDYETVSTIDGGPRVITVRLGAVDTRASAVAEPSVQVLDAAAPQSVAGASIDAWEVSEPTGDRPDLRSARTVVAGGRGLGSRDGFGLAEQLADEFQGAIGATRDAVDDDFAPATTQVGQTGVTVSPELYIGLGVSGAIQHRSGMQTARTIVAINTDEDAPIFEIADFGVVGDVFTVVPALLDELRSRR